MAGDIINNFFLVEGGTEFASNILQVMKGALSGKKYLRGTGEYLLIQPYCVLHLGTYFREQS